MREQTVRQTGVRAQTVRHTSVLPTGQQRSRADTDTTLADQTTPMTPRNYKAERREGSGAT
jgi:hypothetical protein